MSVPQMRRLWYNRPERFAHMAASRPGWLWFARKGAPVENGQSETGAAFCCPHIRPVCKVETVTTDLGRLRTNGEGGRALSEPTSPPPRMCRH